MGVQLNIRIENLFTIFVNTKKILEKKHRGLFFLQAMGNFHAMPLVAL